VRIQSPHHRPPKRTSQHLFDEANPVLQNENRNGVPKETFSSSPIRTLTGALAGGAGLGLLASLVVPVWGLAGMGLGALIGAVAAKNSDQIAYDTKNFGDYARTKNLSRNLAARYEGKDLELKPLNRKDRITADSSSDVVRDFDGFDSSRNITGLLAREGKPDQPYRLGLELAHYRAGAAEGHLNTRFRLETQEGELEFTVEDDGRVLLKGEEEPHSGIRAEHSSRFHQLMIALDKDLLRERGWSDSEPLHISAFTLNPEKDGGIFDGVQARSDRPSSEKFFRWEGKTIYQVMTDRFHNGDTTNDQGTFPEDPNRYHGGDWQGVIDKMDYLKDLGVDVVWISAPYENDRDFFGSDGYHGYWPKNFSKSEPSFGSKEKLKELVSEAHERGMKVMLDVVVNHTGYNHPAVRDPEFRDWFNQENSANVLSDYYREKSPLLGLPDLNSENEDVTNFLVQTHKDWLKETGVDAFRVDAIRRVPTTFMQKFDSQVREGREDFLSLGEVFYDNIHALAQIQHRAQDSLFDFPLMQAIKNVFGGVPGISLKERIERFQETRGHNVGQALKDLIRRETPMTALSSVLAHDHAYENPRLLSTILDNHDTNRFLTDAGGDKTSLKQAAAFIFGVRGMPSIYYGTESGHEGLLGDNRKDMKFHADPDLHQHFSELIHLRKSSEPLQLGSQVELLAEDESYAFTRVLPDEEVVVLFNNAEQAQVLKVPMEESQAGDGEMLRTMLGEERTYQVKDGFLEVEMEPRSYAFLDWKAV
jgi:glycosidase